MKKAVLLAVMAVLVFAPMHGVYAKDSHQGKHDKSDEKKKYDCTLVSKPGSVKWVGQSKKKDALGNGEVKLQWEDSFRAHVVEIEWGMVGGKKKTKETGDDGQKTFSGLTNGKRYEFKVRGKSNCGKGSWSKTYKANP